MTTDPEGQAQMIAAAAEHASCISGGVSVQLSGKTFLICGNINLSKAPHTHLVTQSCSLGYTMNDGVHPARGDQPNAFDSHTRARVNALLNSHKLLPHRK